MIKLLLGGGGLLFLLFGSGSAKAAGDEGGGGIDAGGGAGGGGTGDDGPPPFVVKPAVEQAQCVAAVKDKPTAHDGRSRGEQTLSAWLGWVAYRKSYPDGPADPTDSDHLAALTRLRSCAAVRLTQETKLPGDIKPADPPKVDPPPADPPKEDKPVLPPVSTQAKPGVYYQIKSGDTFFAVTKAAYGTSGGSNVKAAQKVNAVPYNTRFHVPAPNNEVEAGWWTKRITFLPDFGDFAEQLADDADGSYGGNKYAVIYLPPAVEVA